MPRAPSSKKCDGARRGNVACPHCGVVGQPDARRPLSDGVIRWRDERKHKPRPVSEDEALALLLKTPTPPRADRPKRRRRPKRRDGSPVHGSVMRASVTAAATPCGAALRRGPCAAASSGFGRLTPRTFAARAQSACHAPRAPHPWAWLYRRSRIVRAAFGRGPHVLTVAAVERVHGVSKGQ